MKTIHSVGFLLVVLVLIYGPIILLHVWLGMFS